MDEPAPMENNFADDEIALGIRGGAPPAEKSRARKKMLKKEILQQRVQQRFDSLNKLGRSGPPKEKSVRPVSFQSVQLPKHVVTYSLGSVLKGGEAGATLVLVGPWIRGLWIFVESAGVGLIFVLMVLASKRLWIREEVGS